MRIPVQHLAQVARRSTSFGIGKIIESKKQPACSLLKSIQE